MHPLFAAHLGFTTRLGKYRVLEFSEGIPSSSCKEKCHLLVSDYNLLYRSPGFSLGPLEPVQEVPESETLDSFSEQPDQNGDTEKGWSRTGALDRQVGWEGTAAYKWIKLLAAYIIGNPNRSRTNIEIMRIRHHYHDRLRLRMMS